jgi:hypothetical protein
MKNYDSTLPYPRDLAGYGRKPPMRNGRGKPAWRCSLC